MSANTQRRYRQRLRQRVHQLMPPRCRVCGSRDRVNYAHQFPTGLMGPGRGMERRYLDILRHTWAYVPLCYYHHREQEWKESLAAGARGPAKARQSLPRRRSAE